MISHPLEQHTDDPDCIVDYSSALDDVLRRFHMNLKIWKVFKNLVATLGILGLAGFAIAEGASDPTQIVVIALVVIGLINGMELSEFWAAYGEVARVKAEMRSSDGDDE